MRVYLNIRYIKIILVVIAAVLVFLSLLKIVSWWDSKQGAVAAENIQTTAPPSDTPTKIPEISVREPTDEEREGLAYGSMTKDELIQALVDDAIVYPPDESSDGEEDVPSYGDDEAAVEHSGQPGQPVQTYYERRMAEIIAEVYVLRDEYIVTLETMYIEAEDALTELVIKEDSGEAIASLVSSYIARAAELELQCDGQIDTIIAEMDELIKNNDGDMSLIDTLVETYTTEKATKKAWYIDRLEEKGLIS